MKVGLFLPYSTAKWRNNNIRAIQELLKQKGTNPNFQPKFRFLATGPDGTSYMDHPKQSANIVIKNDVHDFEDPTSASTYNNSFVFCALTHQSSDTLEEVTDPAISDLILQVGDATLEDKDKPILDSGAS